MKVYFVSNKDFDWIHFPYFSPKLVEYPTLFFFYTYILGIWYQPLWKSLLKLIGDSIKFTWTFSTLKKNQVFFLLLLESYSNMKLILFLIKKHILSAGKWVWYKSVLQ